MEIMNLPRGCGKSTNIIVESINTGYPIIVGTINQKKYLMETARKITMQPILVYTVNEFCSDMFWNDKSYKPKKVLIDELPNILSILLGTDCEMATMTSKSIEEYYSHRDEKV